MQGRIIAIGLALIFISRTDFAFAQSWVNGSVEKSLSPIERTLLEKNSLDQAPVGPDDCEKKFPFPPNKNSAPYAENGPEICQRLQIRGQRMQCEIDALVSEAPEHNATTGAKVQLAAWARCNNRIANLLVNGYFLPASEIERRLQICSSNFYSDPGKTPPLGLYQRFVKWMWSNDLIPTPSDQALEVALKQSTPLEVSQESAGLMRCEWMYSTSKLPIINPLTGTITIPGAAYSDGANDSSIKVLPKKPTKKSISKKTPAIQ